MKTLIIILLVFGVAEVISNFFHLVKGSKSKIGESARKQHQELPSDTEITHYYYKAIIMFVIGILFLMSSLSFFLLDTRIGVKFTLVNSIFMCVYGLVQLIIYYRTYKVWTSFLVYSIPLVVCLIIL
jgi:hypothetical protein